MIFSRLTCMMGIVSSTFRPLMQLNFSCMSLLAFRGVFTTLNNIKAIVVSWLGSFVSSTMQSCFMLLSFVLSWFGCLKYKLSNGWSAVAPTPQ